MERSVLCGFRKRRYRDAKSGLLFALIPVAGFVLFGLIPQIMSLIISFGDMPSVYIDELTKVNILGES